MYYKLEDKILGEKLCQTKVHLLIGHIGHAETPVQSTKISEGLKPRVSQGVTNNLVFDYYSNSWTKK